MCMLAYYVSYELGQRLAPLLFTDETRMSRSPWNFGGGLLGELSQTVEAATSGAGVWVMVWRAMSRSTATASLASWG